MDEFLSEKEQIEQMRVWWRENGWYLIGGLFLGVASLFGWNRYNAHQDSQAVAASVVYEEVREAFLDDALADALEHLEYLRENYSETPYADQAGLLVAVMRMDAGQLEGAGEDLRYVMEGTSDPELSMIARLRLARVLAHQEAYIEALSVLDVDPGFFSGRFNEVRGDIYVGLNNFTSARDAYNAALTTQESDQVDRGLVQMKLDALPQTEENGLDEITE
ncbi:MAG: hypothetical protein CMM56_09330 [Rhodospirillaceae bacterium]|nr:hypothetical protein [Rhodospirillaceae bacterium]